MNLGQVLCLTNLANPKKSSCFLGAERTEINEVESVL
jgi:hypothetical protein